MTRRGALTFFCLLSTLTGCTGNIRQLRVQGLGSHPTADTVRVVPAENVPPALREPLVTAFQTAVENRTGLEDAEPGAPEGYRVELRVLDAREPAPSAQDWQQQALSGAANALGVSFESAELSGRLAFDGVLFAPREREPVGLVRWTKLGAPSALADPAGLEAGEALGDLMALRRGEFADRRAADERLFLTPTPLTLDPGEFLISNDELLLFRLGWGLSRRVQLDMWFGALPIPVSGGFLFSEGHVVAGGGGAGLGVLGAFDVGLKVRILDESRTVPGLALSYDFLNVFGAALGGGGIAVGDAVVGAVGAAGANAQFNLFSVSVGKHFFGSTHVMAGLYVLDNHHLIPQSAGVTVGVGSDVGIGGGGGTGTPVGMLPIQVQPFLSVEQVLGPHSALAVELLPKLPFRQISFTTGARWLLGFDEAQGHWALNRVRLRIDAAVLWAYLPPTSSSQSALVPLPWVGLGLYFLR